MAVWTPPFMDKELLYARDPVLGYSLGLGLESGERQQALLTSASRIPVTIYTVTIRDASANEIFFTREQRDAASGPDDTFFHLMLCNLQSMARMTLSVVTFSASRHPGLLQAASWQVVLELTQEERRAGQRQIPHGDWFDPARHGGPLKLGIEVSY